MTREEKIKALEDLGVYYKWRVNCKSKRENPDRSLEGREKRVERGLTPLALQVQCLSTT